MSPTPECSNCGREVKTLPSIVAAGGWTAPSEVLYDIPKREPVCSDCASRMLMIMELGIDPGRDGENLKAPRGGVTYDRPE